MPMQETQETQVQSLGQEDPHIGNGNPAVLLPGKSHGQRSLADYTVQGVTKSQT